MEALLKRQTKSLESLESIAKEDRLIQLIQTKEQIDSEKESEKIDSQLVEMNKTLKKSLLDKSGDGVNSNVIKLFDSIKKVTKDAGRDLNKEEVKDITGVAQGRRQYNTVRPRLDAIKDNVKDLFTVRGFLDKTGIAERGSGGLISEYLDRAEEKKKYVDSRMKMDPTAKLHGDEKAREIFAKQFDKQQNIQYDISRNEKKLKEYEAQGFTPEQIARSPEAKKKQELATELAKVDTRVRPAGFDPKTGKVKEVSPQPQNKSATIIPINQDKGVSTLDKEESTLEQNRMIAEQSDLLRKIESNTRGLSQGKTKDQAAAATPAQEAEEGGGLLDMLGNSKFGRVAKNAGRGLLRGAANVGKFALRRAGPIAAVAAVGAGAYEGYTGWKDASEKEGQSLNNIDAKVESGQLTEDEAKKLRTETREQATVERSSAAGKGTGMAIGGAAGALKGAAIGATIGSAVPIVGTVIGGAVGATVGAIGGAWLGGKGGEWLGKKWGQAKNWMFGKSGESDKKAQIEGTNSSVDIQFSEKTFAEKDPDNYAKFAKEREELTKKYAKENAKKIGRDPTPADYQEAKMEANIEVIQKYRKEIEAAGAGKVSGGKKEEAPGKKTEDALKKTADGLDPKKANVSAEPKLDPVTGKPMPATSTAGTAISPVNDQSVTPVPSNSPSSGNILSKASGENEQAKMEANRGGGTANVVSAPTFNNNKTVQNNAPKLPPRNIDNTINRYLDRTYSLR